METWGKEREEKPYTIQLFKIKPWIGPTYTLKPSAKNIPGVWRMLRWGWTGVKLSKDPV